MKDFDLSAIVEKIEADIEEDIDEDLLLEEEN